MTGRAASSAMTPELSRPPSFSSFTVVRVHLIAGGFPVGSAAGHDHDWIRTQLTSMLTTDAVGVQ